LSARNGFEGWGLAATDELRGEIAGEFRIVASVSFDCRKQKQCKVAAYKKSIDFWGVVRLLTRRH